MNFENEVLIITVAIVSLDLIIGDPHSIPHPIVYIGKLISKLETLIRENIKNLKLGGAVLLIASTCIVFLLVKAITSIGASVNYIVENIIIIYILFTALAAKSLAVESKKVYDELKRDNLEEARVKIGYLVGRETDELSKEEIIKATIETVAENTIDGVITPLAYIFIGYYIGAPAEAVYIYKTVNTLDSMVGYKNKRYKELGFFSAKADDIFNFIPARLGSITMLIGGILLGHMGADGLRILIRDRKNHNSPNCGWPESVVAGLLGVQLGGSHKYSGEIIYKPTIGDCGRKVEIEDIRHTIKIMYLGELLFVAGSILIYYCVV